MPTPTSQPRLTATAPSKAGPANPASVYCEQQGSRLEIRTAADGSQTGVCIFPDNGECDEWAYFRGECKPGDSLATPEPGIPVAAAMPSPEPKPGRLRVVYSKGGFVTLWTEGEGARQLAGASTELLRISDDGQVAAYLGSNSAGVYGIYVVNTDGTKQRLLVGQDYLKSIQPAGQVVWMDFAPASHMLYFVTDQYDLHRVNAAASEAPTSVFGAGQGGFFSFSPDGQWMTLYHPDELVLARLDGSSAHVAFQYPEDFRYTMMGPRVVWEPDASGLHIVSASGPQGSPDSMTVWRVPVAGEPVKQMSYAGPYGATLSPDGRQVVYLYAQHESVDVHAVAPDGKDTTYNAYSSQSYINLGIMGWTPDSKRFLLNLSKDGRLAVPYLCAVDEQPVKLTDTEYANSVTYVDAERFLFVSGDTLRLQRVGEPSRPVDAVNSSAFDYTTIRP
jgi:putative hemolysin